MANCVQCGRQLPGLTFGKKLCQWCVQHEAAQRGEDSPIQRVEPVPWMRQQSSSMAVTDRKSTRLNSSHLGISYAVFCLEKRKTDHRLHGNATGLKFPNTVDVTHVYL